MIGFYKETSTNIEKLTDERLVKVNPQEPGFFSKVTGFETDNREINQFIDAVKQVEKKKLAPFYVAKGSQRMKPNGTIIFVPSDCKQEFDYKEWLKATKQLPTVEEKQWGIATEYQYYAYLVYILNKLVDEKGLSVEVALGKLVWNEKKSYSDDCCNEMYWLMKSEYLYLFKSANSQDIYYVTGCGMWDYWKHSLADIQVKYKHMRIPQETIALLVLE